MPGVKNIRKCPYLYAVVLWRLTLVPLPQLQSDISLQKFARRIFVVEIVEHMSVSIFWQADSVEESNKATPGI